MYIHDLKVFEGIRINNLEFYISTCDETGEVTDIKVTALDTLGCIEIEEDNRVDTENSFLTIMNMRGETINNYNMSIGSLVKKEELASYIKRSLKLRKKGQVYIAYTLPLTDHMAMRTGRRTIEVPILSLAPSQIADYRLFVKTSEFSKVKTLYISVDERRVYLKEEKDHKATVVDDFIFLDEDLYKLEYILDMLGIFDALEVLKEEERKKEQTPTFLAYANEFKTNYNVDFRNKATIGVQKESELYYRLLNSLYLVCNNLNITPQQYGMTLSIVPKETSALGSLYHSDTRVEKPHMKITLKMLRQSDLHCLAGVAHEFGHYMEYLLFNEHVNPKYYQHNRRLKQQIRIELDLFNRHSSEPTYVRVLKQHLKNRGLKVTLNNKYFNSFSEYFARTIELRVLNSITNGQYAPLEYYDYSDSVLPTVEEYNIVSSYLSQFVFPHQV